MGEIFSKGSFAAAVAGLVLRILSKPLISFLGIAKSLLLNCASSRLGQRFLKRNQGFWEISFGGFHLNMLRKLGGILRMLENIGCAVGLLLPTLMVFAQVLNRYGIKADVVWINDLAVFFFVFYMFFALIMTTRENGHIALEVLADKIFGGTPVRKQCYSVFLRLVTLAIVVAIMPATWRFAARAYRYPQYATLVRWFNTSWMMEAMFVGMCIVLLHVVVLFIEDAVKLRSLLLSPGGNEGREP